MRAEDTGEDSSKDPKRAQVALSDYFAGVLAAVPRGRQDDGSVVRRWRPLLRCEASSGRHEQNPRRGNHEQV